MNQLFEGADLWLAKALARSGLPPEATARRSDDDLFRAQDALDAAVRWRRVEAKALDDLEAFAARHVSDFDTRELLLRTVHPKLPGSISMRSYCRDDATLQRCKDIIKPPKKGR